MPELVIQAFHGQAVATPHEEPCTPEQESFAGTRRRRVDQVWMWGQAVVALDDLAGRADALVSRVAQARAVLSHPAGLLVSGLLGMLVARLALRRRPRTWLRWAWLGWRTWRVVAPTLRAAFARR